MASAFVSIPIEFAGSEPMTLSVFEPHLLARWSERMGKRFSDGRQCAELIASYLADPRLLTIYERVPVYGNVALYVEKAKTLFFMTMGTKIDPNEVKVSTVLYRADDRLRMMVNEEDHCYILPAQPEGKLRYGRERKFFECKKRTPKWSNQKGMA